MSSEAFREAIGAAIRASEGVNEYTLSTSLDFLFAEYGISL